MKSVKSSIRKAVSKFAATTLAALTLFSCVTAYAAEATEETEDTKAAVQTEAAAPVVTGSGVLMSTAYPGISVKAGDSISFPLDFISLDGEAHDVSVRTEEIPDGWTGYFSGNSTEITKVHVSALENDSELADYVLAVPDEAEEGSYSIALSATTDEGDTDTLTLELTVSSENLGESNFSAEYPALEGTSGTSFSFDTTLINNRAADQSYSLSAQAPEGWTITFTPSGESSNVASVTVESGGSVGLTIDITPPETVEKGDYTIPVSAVSSADTLNLELSVSITGTYSVMLTTSDGILSFNAQEEKASTVTLVVMNDGNVDLQNLNLSSSAPTDWDVSFSESSIDILEAGASKEITMTVTPCENAITGDYETDITISNDESSDTIQFRVSVKTSTTWGIAAVCIILALIIVLVIVIRRYGRR